MVYSDSTHPNGFHPPPSSAPLLLHILVRYLPSELVLHILSIAHIHRRTWSRRLESVPSRSVMSYYEYMRSVRTYLETPLLGKKRLRRVVVSIGAGGGWRGVWPDSLSPSMLRASLIRRSPDKGDIVIAHELLEPPAPDDPTRASFSVTLDEDSGELVKKARPGDRVKISLMPHFRTRSGVVPVVKEVTVYVYSEW